jgi:hypothetical protein
VPGLNLKANNGWWPRSEHCSAALYRHVLRISRTLPPTPDVNEGIYGGAECLSCGYCCCRNSREQHLGVQEFDMLAGHIFSYINSEITTGRLTIPKQSKRETGKP